MSEIFLQDFILVVASAFAGGFIARTIKFPPILGYIFSGILFGIVGKSFISSYSSLIQLSQVGISLLLFTYGFEFSLQVFKQIEKRVFIIGLLQLFITTIIILPILLFVGLTLPISILFSVLFSFSSTTVVMKILEEKGKLHAFPGNLIFIILLLQDLFIVPVIVFMPVLFAGKTIGLNSSLLFLTLLLKPLLIFIAILILSKLFLGKILNFLFKYPSHELTILATIFTAAVAIALFRVAGLPDSISAFLAGVIISQQGKNLAPLTEIRPLRDLFLVIFFVLTGMLFSFPFFIQHLLLILLLTLLVIGIKFVVLFCLLRIGMYKLGPSVSVSSYLMNVGEFAVVIGQLAFIQHNISANQLYLLLSVFILSLLFVPFENSFFEHLYKLFKKNSLAKKIFPDEHGNVNHGIQTELKDHVVICGHGRIGNEVRNMVDLAGLQYVVIDFNRQVVNDLRGLGKNALYGDPTDTDILRMAHVATASALVIAIPDLTIVKKIIQSTKTQNLKIAIFCTAHESKDQKELIKYGAQEVVFPEFEAGLQIGKQVLKLYKVNKAKQNIFISRIKRQAYED